MCRDRITRRGSQALTQKASATAAMAIMVVECGYGQKPAWERVWTGHVYRWLVIRGGSR